MNASDRYLLEALMFGLGVPSSSSGRPAWMADGACIEHPEVEFIPADQRSEDKPPQLGTSARGACAGPIAWPTP